MPRPFGEIPEPEKYFYSPYKIFAVNHKLEHLVRANIARAEKERQVGLRLTFAMSPGIAHLALPYTIQRGDGKQSIYNSTFDRLYVGTLKQGSGRRFFDISLGSTHPVCCDTLCMGCSSCCAPLFLFDVEADTIAGRRYDVYAFCEELMRPETLGTITRLSYSRPVGNFEPSNFDDTHTRDTHPGHRFTNVVDSVVARLATQSFELLDAE